MTEIGIYALLAGFPKAATDLNLSEAELKQSIVNLALAKPKFLSKVRQVILEKGMKENTKTASKHFGISEYLIIDMLRKYLSEEANSKENTIYPYDTFDRFTQTCELPQKHWMHVASQTDLPYKVPKKSYSTLDKIEEIRKSDKGGDSNVSSSNIEKWKDKIKKSLFQEIHIQQIYTEGKKDKFLTDIDTILVEFYKAEKPTDEKLKKKCIEIVQFSDASIEVSDNWISKFKSHYQLE